MTDKNKNKTNLETMDDRQIQSAVQSVKAGVPDGLDSRVTAMLNAKQEKQRRKGFKLFSRPLLWYPLTGAALLVIVMMAGLFWSRSFPGPAVNDVPPIAEIKTELELADADIKIIWVQKKDFKL
ncbi:MAG: hypothetical protein GY940_24605 [bacterium]|nr:hypothetical protein [bacterium]